MRIDRLDHLLVTVADIDLTGAFHRDALGMRPVVLAGGRTALTFGRSKIRSSRRRPAPWPAAPTSG